MTLILILGNREQYIQISDRRLSVNGRFIDDESNKAGVLFSSNGTLAYGFTGLARTTSGFETSRWLNSVLCECGPPDYLAYNILQRLVNRATNDFHSLPSLKYITPSDKRLAIVFSGYLTNCNPPLSVFAVISNSSAFADVKADGEQFEFKGKIENTPGGKDFAFLHTIGFRAAITTKDKQALMTLIEGRKPARAIIGKAIEVMHSIADRPQSIGTIGKQLSSIIVSKNHPRSIETYYHSDVLTYKTYMPDQVFALSDQEICANMGISVGALNPNDTQPIGGPKLPRNAPCWCGSGKKFKWCHGRGRAF